MQAKKLTFTALFIAIGVLSAHLIYIPVGVSRCFPVQHAINVLLAALLGTRYSLSAAFGISLLRNILGTGSLLAFPGSMFGAALAGILYQRTGHILGAVIGEIIGTGIIGGFVAYPVAKYFLGTQAGALFFVIPFLISTTGGSIIAWLLYHTPLTAFFRQSLGRRN
ncbi:MAG: energy coupling factor transporter S component ThiW [Negativicutes bacterium]|nr:energy coupling factor transporter S component ThiW [Negativicutes bacterium]